MCVCVRVCLQREKDPKYLTLCTIFSVRSKYTRILEKIRTLSPESVHELITICDLIIKDFWYRNVYRSDSNFSFRSRKYLSLNVKRKTTNIGEYYMYIRISKLILLLIIIACVSYRILQISKIKERTLKIRFYMRVV